MSSMVMSWDPSDLDSWAANLGLVRLDLLPPHRSDEWPAEAAVLLDGPASSFVACVAPDADALRAESPLAWSWSANLRHTLMLDLDRDEMLLRRWDIPDTYRVFKFPPRTAGAEQLLEIMEAVRPAGEPDVILFVLRAFRRIREILRSQPPVVCVDVLNAFLVGTDAVRTGALAEDEWTHAQTIREAFGALEVALPCPEPWLLDIPQEAMDAHIGPLTEYFLRPEGRGPGLTLHPDLLLRHAAGELYQEAHLLLERDPQLALPGIGGDSSPRGMQERDVRFTPTALARSLVQQTLRVWDRDGSIHGGIDVLDPACGSGVFLLQALHELVSERFAGAVRLRGFDTSDISCAIARFCLSQASREAQAKGIHVAVSIEQADALTADWGSPDVVLMNPPFVAWPRLSPEEQVHVKEVLGGLARGRVDEAMAFVWLAVTSLPPGGVLGTVLPSPLMETHAGTEWREAIADRAVLHLIGRFEGYGYFPASMVEPGFIVLAVPPETERLAPPTRIVYAREGAENRAIRALRSDETTHVGSQTGWEIFDVQSAAIAPASWLPRPREHMDRVATLMERWTPAVADLFEVHQGARTGANDIFILSEEDIKALPRPERGFFRPAATNATVHRGILERSAYVFYPYDESGLCVTTEAELEDRLRVYYERWLLPAKEVLAQRPHIAPEQWWALARPREWQRVAAPKVVTKYFGEKGSFAYDESGDFVVVQGHGWIWRGGEAEREGGLQLPRGDEFHDSPLVWAYLAILNSPLFEQLLACFCPRVQGGQFNLSKRFIDRVFLPNLADDLRVTGATIEELAALGQQIHAGRMPSTMELAQAAAKAYGVPTPGDIAE